MGSKGKEMAGVSDDPELEEGRQSGSDRSRSLVSYVLLGIIRNSSQVD